jgi:hypothetical protein
LNNVDWTVSHKEEAKKTNKEGWKEGTKKRKGKGKKKKDLS